MSRLVAVVVVAVLAVAGCGTSTSSDEASGVGGPPEAAGAALLDFEARAVGGGEVHGSDYAGRDLIVWFWAPW